MIYGLIVSSIISYVLNGYYTGVFIGYTIREQLRDGLPYFIMSGLMGIAIYALGLLPFPNDWSLLLTKTVTGIVLYVSLCHFFRLGVFMELWKESFSRIAALRARAAR
jgi:hypothetical protein